MISIEQVRALLTQLAMAEPLPVAGVTAVVIDAREEHPSVHHIYYRPWALHEIRMTDSDNFPIPDFDCLAQELHNLDRPVFVLSADPPAHTNLILRVLRLDKALLICQSQDSKLTFQHRCIDDANWESRSDSTHIIIRGICERSFARRNLPQTFQLEAEKTDRTRWIVGVEVRSLHVPKVPDPVWYRLTESSRGTLSVDIKPASDQDKWNITWNGRAPSRITPPQLDARRDSVPDRLAVILDRTCPDVQWWTKAKDRVAGALASGSSAAPTKDPDSPFYRDQPRVLARQEQPDVAPRDFNRTIRDSLSDALYGLLGDRCTIVDGWWFADVVGDGFSSPPGLELVDHTHGFIQSARGENIRSLFSGCTYSPGLDLYDPVEVALEEALDKFQFEAPHHAAIVIVGNSPPSVPSDPRSKLRELLEFWGFRTTYRRQSPVWHSQLVRARERNIPIIYLFLSHNTPDCERDKDFQRYLTLHGAIADALRTDLPVEVVPATPNDIHDGLRRALTLASSPTICLSNVRVI